jgi:hypothetical protein
MPELDAAGYLWGFLGSAGITEPGPNGPIPVSWASLEGWQRCNGLQLRPWEVRAMRSASSAFVSEWYAAQDPARPAPWLADWQIDRAKVADKIGALFSARAKRKK